MSFEVINIGDVRWVGSVMGLPKERRDIHLDQRMLAPYVAAYGWRAHLAYSQTDTGYVIQPVLITKDGELRHSYNFGGPIAGTVVSKGDHFYHLKEWARDQGCTKEYCTLIPNLTSDQLKLLQTSDINPKFSKLAVVVDLKNMKPRGTTRRLANKSQSMGVTVKAYPSDHLSHFIKIYNETMDRVNAKEHWRFSDKWFEYFTRLVKPQLMLAEYKGDFVAGCLIAYSQQYPVAYYHFAGCIDLFMGKGVSQQMVLAACEFTKSAGIDRLFLGGGVTSRDDDGLLVFKSGFSPLKQPVYTYERNFTGGT